MNKQDRMREQILQHGFKLQRIFPETGLGPVELCKKLHRIEGKAHRQAEDVCNGYLDETDDQHDKRIESILNSVDRVTGFRKLGIPVFINGDPRGYALKIRDSYVREHNLDILRDWGGYGILAPDFDGS